MAIVTIPFVLPALLYAAVFMLCWRAADADAQAHLPQVRVLLAAGLVLHAGTLLLPWRPGVVHYGFAKLSSATVWFGLLLMWIDSFELDVRRLLLAAMPVAGVLVVLPLAWPGSAFRLADEPPLFLPHLIAGTLAYGLMFLAALHAVLMVLVERRLHPRTARTGGVLVHRLLGDVEALPPLMTLERTLYRFIGLGFVLLVLTTLTGVLFSEQTFGRPLRLEHKTLFSIISTAVFGLLLLGRRLWGWRGRLALRLAGWGFGLLLLSYVGSRFVLEAILHRVP